jgi:hypothetical protein
MTTLDIEILSKIANDQELNYNDIYFHLEKLSNKHPLIVFLHSFRSIRIKVLLMNLQYLDIQSYPLSVEDMEYVRVEDLSNPFLRISFDELYSFIKQNNIVYDIKFNDIEDKHDCVICLDVCKNYKLLKCGHIFHEKCIDEWLIKSRGTCALCKKNLFLDGIIKWFHDHLQPNQT